MNDTDIDVKLSNNILSEFEGTTERWMVARRRVILEYQNVSLTYGIKEKKNTKSIGCDINRKIYAGFLGSVYDKTLIV